MKRDRYTYLKAYRDELARVGLCVYACGREATKGQRCLPCHVKARKGSRASYYRMRARGRCVNCPRPARPGHSRCGACTKKQAERDERRALHRRYAAADAAARLDILTARAGD